jgi:erythromycin esterase-like protein
MKSDLPNVVRNAASPLRGGAAEHDEILDRVEDARFVLIGDSSHGTHEFYRERAELTRRLIEEKGFHAVAAEADWPDAYRVNRYVQGRSEDGSAIESLADFQRFPAWMWRNADVLDFIGWLRDHNDRLAGGGAKVGFYGLDLYSLQASIQAVITYLDRVDPQAARVARQRYGCFDHFAGEGQSYGYMAGFDLAQSCENEVVAQLMDLRRQAEGRSLPLGEDEHFVAEQNARVVKDAEHYYRTMFRGRISSWNIRDRHMMDTLRALVDHLDDRVGRSKVVVWAHNSHLGDARATEMGDARELNLGQLVRESYGDDALLIGMTTYEGTVTAASEWDAPAERKAVRPALPQSYEAIFHATGLPRLLLMLRDDTAAREQLLPRRLERAIGVVYLPQTERASHYFEAILPEQFDAIIHFDETRAVEPLERTARWDRAEVPETFPSAV